MGEAKIKKRSHAAILAGNPGCIYCAGKSRADTIEHMPPIAAFRNRQRPKGLEFPACVSCNNGTRHSDLVASLIARVWPDGDAIDRSDVQKLLQAVANNVPGLLQEMMIGRGAEKLARKRYNLAEDIHPMRANGPLLTRHILTFAAKLGYALHYDLMGAPIPDEGGAQVMWFSNLQAVRDEIPGVLFEMLPGPMTLQQGVKHVGDQFKYAFARGEADHMLYFASFNVSFAVAGITANDRSRNLQHHLDKFPVYLPGKFGSPIRATLE